jgi:hypothetical protein
MVPSESIPSVTVVPVTRSYARRTSASGPAGIAKRYTVGVGFAWPNGAMANSRADAGPGNRALRAVEAATVSVRRPLRTAFRVNDDSPDEGW